MTYSSGPMETAPALDLPIPTMQRTREYYRAIGYDTPYRWAHNTSAPRRARGREFIRPAAAALPAEAGLDPPAEAAASVRRSLFYNP
jgi:D-proline reductase (dithiol) PrdB